MRKQIAFGLAAVVAMAFIATQAGTRVAAQGAIEPPIVFQAAGPTVASIQSTVDAFRAALGGSNNGNVAGPLGSGRREINWDGGGSTATSLVPTPFDGFLVNRGGRFTTPGSGFVQAPVEGIAATFGQASYGGIFQPFSPVRLFSAVSSNITETRFFIPGGGELPATTRGFGVIFSDVDTQETIVVKDHSNVSWRVHPTNVLFYDADGAVLYSAVVPASPGDASLSFLGVLFADARIARVRIQAGNVVPGGDDRKRDVVMMDDFIYGEPQVVEGPAALRLLGEAYGEGGH